MNFKMFMTKINPINHPAKLELPIPRHRNGRINWDSVVPGTRLRWEPNQNGYRSIDTCNVIHVRTEPDYIRVRNIERDHPIWPMDYVLVCLRSELRAI